MSTNLHWYIWGANDHPRRVARFAVEAESEEEAKARVWKLYDDHDHRRETQHPAKVADSPDALFACVLHHRP